MLDRTRRSWRTRRVTRHRSWCLRDASSGRPRLSVRLRGLRSRRSRHRHCRRWTRVHLAPAVEIHGCRLLAVRTNHVATPMDLAPGELGRHSDIAFQLMQIVLNYMAPKDDDRNLRGATPTRRHGQGLFHVPSAPKRARCPGASFTAQAAQGRAVQSAGDISGRLVAILKTGGSTLA